jgi:dTDP-D-glucose 4,6-dehydratase
METPILHSTGEQRRDYVYIDDLLDICNIVMEDTKAIGETFNVASGKNYISKRNCRKNIFELFKNKYSNI